jgi:hypothetical protein
MKRSAMFQVSPQFIIDLVVAESDFAEKYPDADHVAIHYDFDRNCFLFKFRHPSLGEVGEGELIPVIPAPQFKARP